MSGQVRSITPQPMGIGTMGTISRPPPRSRRRCSFSCGHGAPKRLPLLGRARALLRVGHQSTPWSNGDSGLGVADRLQISAAQAQSAGSALASAGARPAAARPASRRARAASVAGQP